MTGSIDPAVGRGRVRAELFRARKRLDLTRQEVADALGWSLSKMNRIESGHVGISQTDLKALLSHYGVPEHDPLVDEMVELARSSRHLKWGLYRDILNPDYQAYLEYEESSRRAFEFALNAVPGALQSPLYVTALIESVSVGVDPETTRRRIAFRQERGRALLNRPDGPELRFVIAESGLRSWVGSPGRVDAMRDQLDHLIELATRPRIDIRVLPFRYGSHPGLAGGFVVLELPDGHEDVLFRELARQSLVIGDKNAAPYRDLFDRLSRGAVPLETMVDDLRRSFS